MTISEQKLKEIKMKIIFESNGPLLFDLEDILIVSKGIPVKWDKYNSNSDVLPHNHAIEIKFIKESQIKFTESDINTDLKTQLAKKEKQYDESNMDRWKAEEELKKVKEELAAIKSVCPHPVDTEKKE